MPEQLLQVKDLKTYFYTAEGTVRAVDGVSYSVSQGETLAVVGESGCGKSVSALSVMRLVPHPGRTISGQAVFDGRDLLKLSEGEMRSIRGARIAMVFLEPMTSLNPVLTIGEQIDEPLAVHLKMGRRAARARTIELLHSVGIADPERRCRDYPHQLSGGMRQRVMIAMGLSCNPAILIADEPTTALDVTIQAQLLDLMTGLAKQLDTAVIMITHNLGIVARYADRVNVMYAGRIVESGSGDSIFQKPRHPYTIGLLKCVPRIDRGRAEISPIEGFPPDLRKEITGCYFRPRCSYALGRCAREYPPLEEVGGGHWKACFAEI
ncbi:MAG: ABC transporter ATP-binding protein [Dehalococcoidales bacterium]|nr:ABC transporter ATP-binding protein [Dehalococcoidales bacterium]